ncbi:hypothetical protein [Aquimarina sp. AU119]|uniref:hypothetical protein n=1 Tax=Aquimarina sp. AU119 TaxID=2108528 RepID=UPI000D68AF0A|nr:hypothetical protein [Aquimarina sp. AU119]
MKKSICILYISIVILCFSCSDWKQIGNDIYSEAPGDFAGMATAINDDGSIIAIGSPYNDSNGIGSGHVRVFQNKENTWTTIGKDIKGLKTYDHFGSTLDINANGNILAIGTMHSDVNGENSGQVRVFKYHKKEWIQLGQNLNGSKAYDEFGYDISLSQDGKTLAIGAPHHESTGDISSSVSIYTLNTVHNSWELLGDRILGTTKSFKYTNNTFHENQIGKSIALSGDGRTLILNTTGNGERSIITYKLIDNQWVRIGNVIKMNHNLYNEISLIGDVVSINDDGSIIAIGYKDFQISKSSNETKRGNILLIGCIQVFRLNSIDEWKQVGNTIYGTDLERFGGQLMLNASGNRLAVTSYGGDTAESGKDANFVSTFELANNNWKLYGEKIELKRAYEEFDNSIAINNDGSIIIVGNSAMDEDNLTYGEVKIFKNKFK